MSPTNSDPVTLIPLLLALLHDSSNAIVNEDKVVTDLNMSYIHIPVVFENPTLKQLKFFLDVLSVNKERKVWIHCALNYRASAFMYIFHKYYLKTPFDEIDLSLLEQWQPDEKWQNILKTNIEDL